MEHDCADAESYIGQIGEIEAWANTNNEKSEIKWIPADPEDPWSFKFCLIFRDTIPKWASKCKYRRDKQDRSWNEKADASPGEKNRNMNVSEIRKNGLDKEKHPTKKKR